MIVRITTIVHEFLISLDKNTSSKMYENIELLKEFGKNLGLPYSKKITENLYELRTLGKIQIRLFYCFEENTCWVIHGFKKKTNKTPNREIKTAQERVKKLAL